MGILREIVVSNNKPTCREDKSIFKVLRSGQLQFRCVLLFFGWYYHITVPPCCAWLSSFSTSGTHSDWLHCCYGDGTMSIYKIMDRSVTGFASQRCLSVDCSQTWPSWPVINSSRRFWQGLLASQSRNHPRGETDEFIKPAPLFFHSALRQTQLYTVFKTLTLTWVMKFMIWPTVLADTTNSFL